MQTGLPGEDLSESEVEVEEGAPPPPPEMLTIRMMFADAS
jgi:hypothetical protein